MIYISACSASSLTLSGPPSLLQEFLALELFNLVRKLPLPIYGLFHASHLDLPEVDSIVGHSNLLDRNVESHGSLLHPNLHCESKNVSLRELLVHAINDIFRTPLDFEVDIQQIIRLTQGRNVHLTSIGPSRMSHLERALNPKNVHRLGSRELQHLKTPVSSIDHGMSIAVVGMAGRFPDAQDVNELWRILIEGRDLHRRVGAWRLHVLVERLNVLL